MADVRQAAIDVLSSFTGYPDLPNGRPCGVWAYMVANATIPVVFAQRADGQTRRLGSETAAREDITHVIDVPRLDPRSPGAKRLYYAAIETNPAGVMVMTLPKGTQDVLARRGAVCKRVELGQKRQLVELLREFDAAPDLGAFEVIADASMRREAELQRLHVLAIEALLTAGYVVDVESTFEAAARETKEEHGFDFEREQSKVTRVDTFVETAYSKRRLSKQIEHYVYAAHVSDFDETLPRVSEITEDKDPGREGGTYVERGVFLTLPQMWRRAHELRDAMAGSPANRRRCAKSTPPQAALRCWTGSNERWSSRCGHKASWRAAKRTPHALRRLGTPTVTSRRRPRRDPAARVLRRVASRANRARCHAAGQSRSTERRSRATCW